jgi:hypothetical protein
MATNSNDGTSSLEAVGLDMEHAFIRFARVATLVVATIPAYRDYDSGLNGEQRANLTAVRALAISSHIYCMPSRVFRWITLIGIRRMGKISYRTSGNSRQRW